jgi:hypothetical protein
MILLISALAKAHAWARALQDASNEGVTVCASSAEAVVTLQAQEFSAVIFDQQLLDADPDEGRTMLKHIGAAAPVYVNFAISAMGRVVRDLRSALHRRKRELAAAKREAEQTLRNELNSTVTALLLSCQMARQGPDLPASAETRMQDVEALARQVSARLGALA